MTAQNHGGLGVVGRANFVSTIADTESLQFKLQPNQSFESIGISKVDPSSTEAFEVYLDGILVIQQTTSSRFTSTFVPSSTIGADIAIGSIVTVAGKSLNGILVNSITMGNTVAEVVPLPAGGILLLGALAGGALVVRRRRKTA